MARRKKEDATKKQTAEMVRTAVRRIREITVGAQAIARTMERRNIEELPVEMASALTRAMRDLNRWRFSLSAALTDEQEQREMLFKEPQKPVPNGTETSSRGDGK